MSFLLPTLEDEREANATLQDAFAFIDAYGDEGPHACASSRAVTATASAKTEPQDRPVKKKKMEHRDRVKSELQRLRAEAEVLEATLLRLKFSPAPYRTDHGLLVHSPIDVQSFDARAATRPTPMSMEIVVREYRRRKASETTNQKLKALLAKQLKVARSPGSALAHQLSGEEMTLLSCETVKATVLTPRTATDAYSSMMLAARVNQLEIDMQRLMISAGLTDQPLQFFRTQRSVNEALGVAFEIVSSIPLMHTMEATDQVFWHILLPDLLDDDPGSSRTDFSRTFTSSVSIHGEQYQTASSAVFRKRATSDWIVYIWSSVAPMMQEGFSIYEDVITTMRRGPGRTCQLQFWHRIHADEPNVKTENTKRKRLRSLKEAILRQHSRRAELFYRDITDKLLDDTPDASIEDLVLRTSALCSVDCR